MQFSEAHPTVGRSCFWDAKGNAPGGNQKRFRWLRVVLAVA
jgi:hypothetical protein